MSFRQSKMKRKQGRFRNLFKGAALACAIGIPALMPLKADARIPNISSISHEDRMGERIYAPDPAGDTASKGESAFRPLERSGLSLGFSPGRINGVDTSLIPYGYSWKIQDIDYGGGLILGLGSSSLGGEWNSRDGTLLILGYHASLARKRLDLKPWIYLAPQSQSIGARLRIGFEIGKNMNIYSDSYLMSRKLDQIDSMNFMVGFSFDM